MAQKNKANYSPYKKRQLEKNAVHQNKSSATGSSSAGLSYNEISSTKASSLGNHGRHRQASKVFTQNEANDRLMDLFKNHDFSHITHAQRGALASFYVELMENQKKENFTRLLELKDIGIKHFIDCLIIPRLTELKFPLLDVGTGPGFPGIPLKMLYPEQTIILGEGVQRRVEFLKQVRENLKLENLPIAGQNINKYFGYPVQGVITRALEDISNTLNNVQTCLQPGGHVYFMKGPGVDPEIEMALKNWSEFYELIQDESYVLPKTDQKRRLVVFKKIKSTPWPDFDCSEAEEWFDPMEKF